MRAGENLTCPKCGGRIKRGEPVHLRGLSYGHEDCLPLAPYAPVGAQASPHVAAVPVGHARPPAGGAG